MPEVNGGNGGAERQKKGRWKRAAQVCTNCRQMKLRCDFQERFPEPCTRCATAGQARGMPCHVDPSFRRATKRTSEAIPPAVVAAEVGFSGSSVPKASTIKQGRTRSPDDTDDAETPPSFTVSNSSQRSLGTVTLGDTEVAGLFNEFFEYYHKFLPVFLDPVTPDDAFAMTPYLFWAICSIASRPRDEHPVPRARVPDLCVALGQEVFNLFSQMLVERCRTYHHVQALLLICEYPFVLSRGREDFIWLYSGMAISIGTTLGLHRHRYAAEYSTLDDQEHEPALDELKERILTWVQCFNIHQSMASFRGFPGLMADDYLLVKGATKPVETMSEHINYPDVFRSLRIYRLTRRLTLAVGNDSTSPSGQAAPATRKALLGMFAAELSDLEASLKPKPDAELSPISAVRLLEAKLHLHAFELQGGGENATPEDLLICYTSSVRIINTLTELSKDAASRVTYWPRSMYASYVASVLCLLKLATLQIYTPRKLSIERTLILKEVSVAYDVMKMRSIFPGDVADRRSQGLRFLCAHLQKGTPVVTQSAAGTPVRSRMSLGGLLYDSLRQIKAMRAAKLPGVEEVFNRMEYPPFSPASEHARPPEVELPAPPVEQPTPNHPVSATSAVPSMQDAPNRQASVTMKGHDGASALYSSMPITFTNAAMDQVAPHEHADDVQGPAAMGLTWDNVDISNLPSMENTEWLQLLSVENCTEIMSVPGFDANYNMPWDSQDVSMADPFNFAASGF